jgi:formylglycine-generating enzyme required for sulfatase activity
MPTTQQKINLADPQFFHEMIPVKGGTFIRSDGETKQKVTLSDYYIGKYPVTQALYEAVMGKNPSLYKNKEAPVTNISWHDCNEFIKKLNKIHTQKQYRLPTEAEWEYAAIGGEFPPFGGIKGGYAGSSKLAEVGWYRENKYQDAIPVGLLLPNALGLHDMSGNVWEWCEDWYKKYPTEAQKDPKGLQTGQSRVLRGGSRFYIAEQCTPSFRNYDTPDFRHSRLGFRLVLPSAPQVIN